MTGKWTQTRISGFPQPSWMIGIFQTTLSNTTDKKIISLPRILFCLVAPNTFQGQPCWRKRFSWHNKKISQISCSCQIVLALNCLHLLGLELVQWGISCLPSVNSLCSLEATPMNTPSPMQIKGKAVAAVTRGLEAGKCHTTFEVKLI